MPKPVPPLKWIENSPTSILFRADAPRVWHSGRAVDVLPVDDDLVLIGTEAGGVWVADGKGDARPVSDRWDHPDVLCLIRRTSAGPNMFMCGTSGGLYQTVRGPDPLGRWESVGLPAGVREVHRIAELEGGIVVIATERGIYWAFYGHGPFAAWREALRLLPGGALVPLVGSGWHGLARTGPAQLAAGTLGPPPSDPSLVPGGPPQFVPLVWGRMQAGALVFRTAALGGVPEQDLPNMTWTTIASCEGKRESAWAVSFHDTPFAEGTKLKSGQNRVFHILRTFDGGRTWTRVSKEIGGKPHVDGLDVVTLAHGWDAGGRSRTSACIRRFPIVPRWRGS